MKSRFAALVAAAVFGAIIASAVPVLGKIAASTITGDRLAANSITSAHIVAGTIEASDIAAATITASKLTVSDLASITSNLGAVTAGSIAISGSGQSFSVSGTGFLDVYSSEHDLVHINTQLVNEGFTQLEANVTLTALAGTGNDYACLDANGTIFRSNTAC